MKKVQQLPDQEGDELKGEDADSSNSGSELESISEEEEYESDSSSSEPDYSHLADDVLRPTKV